MKISQLPRIANTSVLPAVEIPVVDPNDTSTPPAGPGGSTKLMTVGQLPFPVEWINAAVAPYNADPTGAADSTTKIQNALTVAGNAGGGVVYLPTGTYKTTAPLIVPTGTTLRGAKGNVYDAPSSGVGPDYGSTIKAATSWAQGSAPAPGIILLSGSSSSTSETAVRDLNIDAYGITPNVSGITGGGGGAKNVLIENVRIYATVWGVTPDAGAYGWRLMRVVAAACWFTGFNGIATDSDYIDCEAIACGQSGGLAGFYAFNGINSRWIGCRSEFDYQYGFYVSGDNTATGGMSMIGCSTDRNAQHGVYVDSTGNWPLLISGMQLRRDGYSSATAGYAGLAVAHAATSPVIVDGLTVFPGYNDDGSGILSPQIGVNVNVGALGAPTYVSVTNALLHAATTPVNGTITNSRAVATRTGAWNAPGAITMVADSA